MPSSVFDNTPAFSSAVTSPCTALTSRSTRRAASRMDMAPAPVIAFSSSQRLPDSTLNNSSGVSKLMRGVDALPLFHVWVKSPSVSAKGRTSIVTVFIAPSPYVLEKIRHQLINRKEAGFNFLAPPVLMITLPLFVVVTQHTRSRNHEGQPVFVAMFAAGKRLWHLPKHQFRKRLFCDRHTTVEQFPGFHVGDDNNRIVV